MYDWRKQNESPKTIRVFKIIYERRKVIRRVGRTRVVILEGENMEEKVGDKG